MKKFHARHVSQFFYRRIFLPPLSFLRRKTHYGKELLWIQIANARDTPQIEVLARIDTAFDGHLVLPVRLIKEPKLESLAPNPERVPHANHRTPIPLWNRVVVHGLLANHVTNYLHSG